MREISGTTADESSCSHLRGPKGRWFGEVGRRLMHLVPAPAVRLMKRRVQSRPGWRQENNELESLVWTRLESWVACLLAWNRSFSLACDSKTSEHSFMTINISFTNLFSFLLSWLTRPSRPRNQGNENNGSLWRFVIDVDVLAVEKITNYFWMPRRR